MTDREKLIWLMCEAKKADTEDAPFSEFLADFLIASGVTVQRWTSASDPPKKRGAILAVFKYGRCKPFVEQITYRGAFADEVTHWMPLPEAPKEEA